MSVVLFGASAWAQESAGAGKPSRPEVKESPGRLTLDPQDGQRSFHQRTDKRTLITQVLRAFGIRATVDQSVNLQNIHFDADDISFAQAAGLLKLATGTFFVPVDPKTVMVFADTPENRAAFQRRMVKSFYFPGLNSKELTDMGNIARNVFGAEQSVLDPVNQSLTVRSSEGVLDVLDRTYRELLVGRGEIQLEFRLYEIDKTNAMNLGIVLPTSATVFNVPSEINSILQNNSSLVAQTLQEYPSLAGNDEAILAALLASGLLTGTVFNSPFAVFGGGLTESGIGLNGVSINLLLNSSCARSVNQVQMHMLDQEEATYRSGERYPIMTSTDSSLLHNPASNGTIPQVQYHDLGLTLKVTPRIELSDRVSLSLDMKLASLAGASLNNIPILANRQYSGVVSLLQGDSAILFSDMSEQELQSIAGVPVLSDISGFSDATNRQDSKDSIELAIVITPHVVRSTRPQSEEPILLPRD